MTNLKLLFFILFTFLYSGLVNAQPSKPINGEYPKVGLVLSGGGAKGFAYVGLLKVLEEVNMPIDYIGGSSMGAITAALYSVGYSPETISEIIKIQDWNSIISDIQERKYIAYEEKLFSEKYIFSIPIEEKIFALSKSINTSFNVDLMLNKLFAPAANIQDFNDLPIPFLCIGTNLLTGEAEVLNKGNLARAVRASMAIPGYFSPTLFNENYLVDGGVVNNYPAEQVKAMGADIIIGGDVQAGLKSEIKEISSMTTILDQVISFNRIEANKKGMELTDYYVKFEMPFSMMDFSDYDSIMTIGEKVARDHYDELKALADSINGLRNTLQQRQQVEKIDSVFINEIIWPDIEKKRKERMRVLFDNVEKNKISFSQLEEKMYLLNGTKRFNELRYEFEPTKTDSLNVKIKGNNSNKGSLAAGLHYDNVYNGSILLNIALRNIKHGRSKFFVDVVLSQNPRLKSMFIINNGFKPGFGLETDFYNFDFSQYKNGEKINSWQFDSYMVGAFMPLTIQNNFLFKTGFQYELFRFKQDIIVDPDLEAYNKFADYGNFYFSFNHDSRDRVNFTRKGQFVEFKFKHVFPFSNQWSDVLTNASIMYLKYNAYVSLSDKIVIKPGLFLGYTFSKQLEADETGGSPLERTSAVQHMFGFGGLNPVNYVESHVPFTGMQFVEQMGLYAGIASLKIEYQFLPKLYTTLMSDFGINETNIDNIDNIKGLFGYGVKLSYNSFIGPIEFSVMSSNIDTSVSTFLNIGFWF